MPDVAKEKHAVTACDLAGLKELFGPPPVLSSESAEAFDLIWAKLTQCYKPKDFMEQRLVRDLADFTWQMMRYTRHETMSIENKVREFREFQAKQLKLTTQRKEESRQERADDAAERVENPTTDYRRFELETDLHHHVVDFEERLDRSADESDHIRALERGVGYIQKLDGLLNAAMRRREDALEMLDRHRRGFGRHMRQVSDEIIDADYHEVGDQSENVVGPPLAPSGEGPQ